MPVYKVKPDQDYPCEVATSSSDKKKKRFPCVYIPVSPEIIAGLKVDGTVEVTLKGFVRGLESRQSSDPGSYNNKNEIKVELRTVDVEAGEDADEDDDEPEESMKDAIDKALGYKKKE